MTIFKNTIIVFSQNLQKIKVTTQPSIFSTTDRGNDRIGVSCVYSYEARLGLPLFS